MENVAAGLPRFSVIESLEEVCLTKFSLFSKEKVIVIRVTLKNVKKMRNGNLFVEVDSWRQTENVLKMKSLQTTKCRAYAHESLNAPKGFIRSWELALSTAEELTPALAKQGMTNIRRFSVRKGKEQIQTNTYILTFNYPHASKKVKIGSCLEGVEKYVPAPLRCFKCQKYGHHTEACRGRLTWAKCNEKDLDHMDKKS